MLRKDVFQRLVLATILSIGFAAICSLASMWVLNVYSEDAPWAGEQLRFLPDGTPLVAFFPDGRRGGDHYRDLQGNPTTPPEAGVGTQLNCCSLPAHPPLQAGELDWDDRVRAFADGRWPATYWYFLSDGRPDGAGYFVGYDSKSNVRVGYLGTAGFRDELLPAEELFPFDGPTFLPSPRRLLGHPGQNSSPTAHPVSRSRGGAPRGFASEWDVYVFGRDGKLYHADLQARTVHVALENSRLRSVVFSAAPPDAARRFLFHLTARTEDALLVLDAQGQQLAHYPIPEALRGLDLTFAESNTGEAVMYWNSPEDTLAKETEYRIFWVKPDGSFRETATTLAHFGERRPMQVYGGVVMPSPLGLGVSIVRERFQELLKNGLEATSAEAFVRALREFWPALAIAQTLAFVFAVLCYRRQVRYGVGRAERIVWPLFVLLLGLPGWIGYRFGRSWPVLETCPACGGVVPRDRGDCARCAAEFPLPELKGTEVFA
ncbi:MAG TPA: hypothetical protein VH575_06050 [Gemmataceae bacterium]|jgi:hypothetical protein